MNIQIHAVHFDASKELIDFINKKLSRLEDFSDTSIEAEIFLKLETKQNIKDKIVEIRVHTFGKTLFVTKTSKTFEESIDMALHTVLGQIKKKKEKIQNHHTSK